MFSDSESHHSLPPWEYSLGVFFATLGDSAPILSEFFPNSDLLDLLDLLCSDGEVKSNAKPPLFPVVPGGVDDIGGVLICLPPIRRHQPLNASSGGVL